MSFISTVKDSEIAPREEALGAGMQKTIPRGTILKAIISSVTIVPEADYNGEITPEKIKITSDVTTDCEYTDYSLNHNLHVHHSDIKKRDEARQKLIDYDGQAKGAISKAVNEGKDVLSNQNFLARSLVGTAVTQEIEVWQQTDKNGKVTAEGNYVKSLLKKGTDAEIKKAEKQETAEMLTDSFEDDEPF